MACERLIDHSEKDGSLCTLLAYISAIIQAKTTEQKTSLCPQDIKLKQNKNKENSLRLCLLFFEMISDYNAFW